MKCVVTALFLAVFGVTKTGALRQVTADSDGVVFSGKGAINDKVILSSGELGLAASSSALLEKPRRKPSPKRKNLNQQRKRATRRKKINVTNGGGIQKNVKSR